jgi:23S rRNA (uracil1939-C5)-methyltransferase
MEITLSKFIYGGETMGRLPDGRAVFIPYALPGERVRIELTFEKRGFARGKLLEVLEASPERVEPKCPYFGECRGCSYQHLPYEAQLRAKEAILRDQLTRIGKIENPPVGAIVPSPKIWGYRNQMDFQLTAGAQQPAPTLEMESCLLPAPVINEYWSELEFGENNLFERLTLRHDAADNLMLIFHASNPETPEMTLEDDLSVVHITAGETIVMGGDDHLVTTLHGRPFRVSATSFFHPNTAVAEKMITHLLKTLPLTAETTLLELYSGIGSFSAFLAPKVAELICVESSPAAGEDFAVNLDEFENTTLYEAQAEAVLPSLDFTPDILLADPPAGGLARQALDGILHLGSGTLVYVSRDPSTFARDAARLIKGGYALTQVTPFDVAPQTAEINSIAVFLLKK